MKILLNGKECEADISIKINTEEPKQTPDFSKVQVGDWVEFSNGEVKQVSNAPIYSSRGVCFEISKGINANYAFLKSNGRHYKNNTDIHAVRILTKSEALRKTTKSENLTFMEACDLLDSGVAKEIVRGGIPLGMYVTLNDMAYTWMHSNGYVSSCRINRVDRLATDWYIKEWA